ncbi:hypothetical protein QO206_05455 [Leeuwenhoekiella aequorea]|uniref:DUF4010 domain-containing protein n=1 Tax=Leeuwenhoekiella aequorea TaxID=283736 RepID=A0A4Q0P6C4_9FLAO|nr:hypothetical protein [Leeuwenhoekiella aequorea]RXG21955.1 hypothetical protein DSM00_2019 [Leeuwenhoekiella aequorea]|tara:strand:+ start:264 stop:548 length:285 start_codon:yes stop_codon:yes gene_type:complete
MNVFSKFHSDFTDNVLGYSALGIILSTCLGSAAVFSVLHFGHGMTQMLIVMLTVILCSTHNAAILTVQKPELIFKLLGASIVSSILIIAGSLLM